LGFLMDQFHHYGDLVTMQAPLYRYHFLVNRPELTHQVLVTQAEKFQKPAVFKRPFISTFGNGLFFSEGSFWRRQRKLAQPAFHHQYILNYGEEMVRQALAMLDRWQVGETRNIAAEMHAVTLNIVVEAIFQTDVKAETAAIAQAITTIGEVLSHQMTNPILAALPDQTPLPLLRRKHQAVNELDRIIYQLIARRRATPGDRSDLLSLLLAVTDEETGERMSDLQAHDEVTTLFIAGHDTTAWTLIWALILLSQHPEVRAKLQTELEASLEGRLPTVDDLPRLPYTDAIIKETLRLYPPVVGILREALIPVELEGLTMQPGEIVWLTPYIIQRDGRYFDRPEQFWPERFGPDGSGQPLERRIPRYAYYPFGGGPRICLGNGFAMLEARLLLATIAQHYRLSLPEDYQVKPKFGPVLGVEGPVPMRILPASD
jgi:cytochrome P450